MHFLIDGYNLLHRMGLMKRSFGPDGLHKARNALLGLLAGTLVQTTRKVVVVFDAAGAPRDVPTSFEDRGIQVYFAAGPGRADALIIQLLQNHSAPKRLTVVSDDHEILDAAVRRGCKTLKSEAFLDELQRLRRRAPPASEPDEKTQGLSESQTEPWLSAFAELADDPAWQELSSLADAEDRKTNPN